MQVVRGETLPADLSLLECFLMAEGVAIPQHFVDPSTGRLLRDPVVLLTGKCRRVHERGELDRRLVSSEQLVSCDALRQSVEAWEAQISNVLSDELAMLENLVAEEFPLGIRPAAAIALILRLFPLGSLEGKREDIIAVNDARDYEELDAVKARAAHVKQLRATMIRKWRRNREGMERILMHKEDLLSKQHNARRRRTGQPAQRVSSPYRDLVGLHNLDKLQTRELLFLTAKLDPNDVVGTGLGSVRRAGSLSNTAPAERHARCHGVVGPLTERESNHRTRRGWGQMLLGKHAGSGDTAPPPPAADLDSDDETNRCVEVSPARSFFCRSLKQQRRRAAQEKTATVGGDTRDLTSSVLADDTPSASDEMQMIAMVPPAPPPHPALRTRSDATPHDPGGAALLARVSTGTCHAEDTTHALARTQSGRLTLGSSGGTAPHALGASSARNPAAPLHLVIPCLGGEWLCGGRASAAGNDVRAAAVPMRAAVETSRADASDARADAPIRRTSREAAINPYDISSFTRRAGGKHRSPSSAVRRHRRAFERKLLATASKFNRTSKGAAGAGVLESTLERTGRVAAVTDETYASILRTAAQPKERRFHRLPPRPGDVGAYSPAMPLPTATRPAPSATLPAIKRADSITGAAPATPHLALAWKPPSAMTDTVNNPTPAAACVFKPTPPPRPRPQTYATVCKPVVVNITAADAEQTPRLPRKRRTDRQVNAAMKKRHAKI